MRGLTGGLRFVRSLSTCGSGGLGADAAQSRINFLSAKPEDVIATLDSLGHPKFRYNQINKWIYDKGVMDPMLMSDLPPLLREKISEIYQFGSMKLSAEQVSAKDGTVKRAYALHDGQLIESVLMPYKDGRQTACISSQAGCAMKCVFCATGQMGFARQLSSNEIFEQVLRYSCMLKAKNKRLSNVVFMGMGEPLNNYDNVIQAIKRIMAELGIGSRHIMISTVGIVPRILQLAEEDMQCGLAVSLHQATDSSRSALMPINKKYPIKDLLNACKEYIKITNRRVSFEWALIKGVTDTETAAHTLGELLQGMLCHVNVIPLNRTSEYAGGPSSKEAVDSFIKILGSHGVTATARVRRGIDISAGCGQLTAELSRPLKKTALDERNNEEALP